MTLYQQAGGNIDKKLEELGVTINDILGLRYRLYQVDYPNMSARNFVEPMAEYYGMLQYKPSEVEKYLAEFFADKGINLSVEQR